MVLLYLHIVVLLQHLFLVNDTIIIHIFHQLWKKTFYICFEQCTIRRHSCIFKNRCINLFFRSLSTFIPSIVLKDFSVSGLILYCIIKCGYKLFKSKDITHLCSPTIGSLTYAPSNLDDLSEAFFCGMTRFFFLR